MLNGQPFFVLPGASAGHKNKLPLIHRGLLLLLTFPVEGYEFRETLAALS
jgi:hypothetical protein